MSFGRVLMANRGEIALRIMRACAAEGLESVAVHAREDAASAHVGAATRSVCIGAAAAGGGSAGGPIAPYLDVDAIVAAALETGAGAVHPGYGFLSEIAALAAACEAEGLAWVGPPAAAIEAFGDKVTARALATSLDVPIAKGSGEADAFATGADVVAWLEANNVELPVMLKAASGGGGRGMRVCRTMDEVAPNFERCSSEAAAAFGDSRVFVEEFVEDAKHLEVQVLWDAHGNGVHLFERDCSVQRRNQKVVEWAPPRNLCPELRAALTSSAIDLTGAANYANAGTVEFLVRGALDDPAARAFFMEVNPRIQVEHTVTEEVTGVDLVRSQLRVAAGQELAAIAASGDVGAVFPQSAIAPRNWAIQCRVSLAPPLDETHTGVLAAYAEPAGHRVDAAGDPWRVGDAPSTLRAPRRAGGGGASERETPSS